MLFIDRIIIHSKPYIWYRLSAIIVQEVGLPADELEATNTGTDDGNGHGTHRSATDINIPAASANSNLTSLREGLRNTNKWKLVRECDCSESIDAVEAEDESQIIICGQKGCETLWVSHCLFMSFHSACSPLIMQYHLLCVGLNRGISDWVCNLCKSAEKSRGRGSKWRHGVDKTVGWHETHSPIYRIYLYMEGYSHAWLVSSAMVALRKKSTGYIKLKSRSPLEGYAYCY